LFTIDNIDPTDVEILVASTSFLIQNSQVKVDIRNTAGGSVALAPEYPGLSLDMAPPKTPWTNCTSLPQDTPKYPSLGVDSSSALPRVFQYCKKGAGVDDTEETLEKLLLTPCSDDDWTLLDEIHTIEILDEESSETTLCPEDDRVADDEDCSREDNAEFDKDCPEEPAPGSCSCCITSSAQDVKSRKTMASPRIGTPRTIMISSTYGAAGTRISEVQATRIGEKTIAHLNLVSGSLALTVKPQTFTAFTVLAGDWHVTVTGTVFTLTRTSEELRVSVTAGSVSVSNRLTAASGTVTAGQTVSCSKAGQMAPLSGTPPKETITSPPATNQSVSSQSTHTAPARDRLTLKDGTVLVGSISIQDASHISIQTEYGAHVIPRKEVVRIDVLP